MTESCVALLRGINVGGRNRLPMKQLVEIAEQRLGLEDCRTYVQSGNLVFSAQAAQRDGLEARLESAIEAVCGFRAAVLLRSAAEWDAIVAGCPFAAEAAAEPKQVHVFVLAATPEPDAVADLAAREFGDDRWHLGPHCLYLHTPNWSSALALQAMLHAGPN